MQIVYSRPVHRGVTIAATGQHTLPGVEVDVPDDVAERAPRAGRVELAGGESTRSTDAELVDRQDRWPARHRNRRPDRRADPRAAAALNDAAGVTEAADEAEKEQSDVAS
jgi:hypothetical protein